MTLPAHTGPVAGRPAVAIARENARRALIVDDEAPVRKLLARLLKRRGFDVFEAETGAAALAVAAGVQLSLVLCDVRLPGTHGTELYRELISRIPSWRVPSSSSPAIGPRSQWTTRSSPLPLLLKPFSAADLDAALTGVGIDTPVG